jgi:hypothetical protein
VQTWVDTYLAGQGFSRPACKRLALLLTGLVAGEPATVSGLSRTLAGLAVTPAQEPSIARRLLRLLADPQLDALRLLPALFGSLLPEVLAGLVTAHQANQVLPAAHHARFRPLRVVVDETSQEDAVHLLVVGLWYQGLVLPLAVRTWEQNTPLPEDEWWSALGGLLWQVHALVPPVLRDHVLLLADRGYGHPRMVDLASALGWAWVLRVSGQVRVQFADGREAPLRTLVPQPGMSWGSGTTLPERLPDQAEVDQGTPVAVFKKAGWRRAHLVAVWLPGQAEPWLLVTNRSARVTRLAEYARRWAIERLFLCWKSHGWDLEAGRVRDPVRLGRLVGALALATWWRVAIALPCAAGHLAKLAHRAHRAERAGAERAGAERAGAERAGAERAGAKPPASCPFQLGLPFPALSPPPRDRRDGRPWEAKFSLFTWGARTVAETACQWVSPMQDWTFPDWEAPTWSRRCQSVYHPAT